ncbi:hypothetical protein MBLNU230_g0377t2 [Neophaeotheca triangularis]
MLMVTSMPDAAQGLVAREDLKDSGKNRFECRSCPYQMILDRRYYERKPLSKSEQNDTPDVLGGSEAWANVDKTETRCPRDDCDSLQAYFRQVQIRSADEPMTSFYKCVLCAAEWREN